MRRTEPHRAARRAWNAHAHTLTSCHPAAIAYNPWQHTRKRDCIVFASTEHAFEYRMPPSQLSRLRAFMTNPLRIHYRSVNSKKKYYIFQNSRNKVPATHVIVIAWKFKIRLRRKRSDREAKADLKRSGRQERGKSRARGSQGSLWAEDVPSAYFFTPKQIM